MSFVDEEDVYAVCEEMLARMFDEAVGVALEPPLPRMTWAEAVESYGTDKPDLRIPWRLADLTGILTGIGFGIFDSVAETGGRVRGVVVPGGAALSRKQLEALDQVARAGRPTPTHHAFTMPKDATPEELRADPYAVGSRAYDLVLNGTELLSGSIRCHDAELQRAILSVIGMGDEEIEERFGFLLEAFRYGVPPHGGFALGLDRLVAMMVGASSIREVIAFPKTTAARGLMEGAPSPMDPQLLAELGLRPA
jgi:aspartyl-tRNA synthetase